MPGQGLAVDSPSTDRTGDVVVKITPEISKLLNAYSEHKHVQKGYRVQIFLGDRATAEATKRSFLQKNPDIAAYLSWLAPNFRLRVGDLRTRLEAEHLLRDMKVLYPGSYIVPDEIEMPRVD
ncbi:MAG: SPOR domain-containing protein [Flavobacteriales bacterium]|nr:SPOR domain-containing protein [Flavobacteriales bacterium]